MKLVVYYQPSGVIQQTCMAGDDDTPAAMAGLEFIEMPWEAIDARSMHVANGALVAGALDVRTLAQAQADQIAVLEAAYTVAIAQPVSYTSKAGVAQTYQADPGSIANVANMQLAFAAAGATPAGFYWLALDNTQVPFTYADVQGLAAAMGAQGFAAFAHLQAQKDAVRVATTNAAALAVAW
jgi:hypothetical protein